MVTTLTRERGVRESPGDRLFLIGIYVVTHCARSM